MYDSTKERFIQFTSRTRQLEEEQLKEALYADDQNAAGYAVCPASIINDYLDRAFKEDKYFAAVVGKLNEYDVKDSPICLAIPRDGLDGFGLHNDVVSRAQLFVDNTIVQKMLYYTCAENADLQPIYVPKEDFNRKKAARKNISALPHVAVGSRVGAALRAYERAQEASSTSHDSERIVRPHIRRAHFHTYRCGPGREDTVVHWIHPILVNADLGGMQNTIHEVPAPSTDFLKGAKTAQKSRPKVEQTGTGLKL